MSSTRAAPGIAALQETHGHEGDRVALPGDPPHHGTFGSFDERAHVRAGVVLVTHPHHPSQNSKSPTLGSDPREDPQYSGICGRR
eukprot:3781166-Pyramimonas_sp.AAC.1